MFAAAAKVGRFERSAGGGIDRPDRFAVTGDGLLTDQHVACQSHGVFLKKGAGLEQGGAHGVRRCSGMLRWGSGDVLFGGPVFVPLAEQAVLVLGVVALGIAQHIAVVEVQAVLGVAIEHHQVLVVEHQVSPFIER